MFEKIRIKNFRSIEDSGDLDLSNLNIIVGPNNSGKSSLLYSLLLMKQSFEEMDIGQTLITSGLIDLGSFWDLLPNYDINKVFSFSFKFKKENNILNIGNKKFVPFLEYEYEFSFDKENNKIKILRSCFKDDMGKTILETKTTRNRKAILTLSKKNREGLDFYTQSLIPRLIPKNNTIFDAMKKTDEYTNLLLITSISASDVQRRMKRLKYIAPIRERIPRLGLIGTMPYSELGPSGQNLLKVLSSKSNEFLIKELRYWLDEKFKILKNIEVVDIDDAGTVKALVAREFNRGPRINLNAMGCGISEMIPIIVQSILLQKGGCLLVEQPEIHIHPKAQADLADLFIENAKRGKQFIIETHSEHLILRIRRRVAEKKIDPKMIRIFYVEKINNKTQIKTLSLNGKGHFDKWPKGFFEEGFIESIKLAEASNK